LVESFGTREPSPKPVVPLSPVRVTIRESRWPINSAPSGGSERSEHGGAFRTGYHVYPRRRTAPRCAIAPTGDGAANEVSVGVQNFRHASSQWTRKPVVDMALPNPYEIDLDRNAANYTPLTPLSLIARTAYTYPEHVAVVHGDRRYTWA